MTDRLDLSQRPASYFRPQALDQFLLSRVQNEVLRMRFASLLDAGRADEVRRMLGDAGLSRADQRRFEQFHPRFLGGNYLPEGMPGEVEIARIAIDSTTCDVTCVYARKSGAEIHYRVVDEYEGDTLSGLTEIVGDRPLTLGELVTFFLGAWDLNLCTDANFEEDLDGKLGFFHASSAFYPQLQAACVERVIQHHKATYGEAEADDTDG